MYEWQLSCGPAFLHITKNGMCKKFILINFSNDSAFCFAFSSNPVILALLISSPGLQNQVLWPCPLEFFPAKTIERFRLNFHL